MGSEHHDCLSVTQTRTAVGMLTRKAGDGVWEIGSFPSWHQSNSLLLTKHDTGRNIWEGILRGAGNQILDESCA